MAKTTIPDKDVNKELIDKLVWDHYSTVFNEFFIELLVWYFSLGQSWVYLGYLTTMAVGTTGLYHDKAKVSSLFRFFMRTKYGQ